MKNNIKLLVADKGIRYALILSSGVLVLQSILLGYMYIKLPPLVPLFNSLSWGRERLVPSVIIFAIPLFLIFIAVVNLVFSSTIYKKYALVSRILLINLLIAVLLSTIAIFQILLLVF